MSKPPLQLLRRAYHAAPTRFGSYPLLPSSLSLTSYPAVLPVPSQIPRPPYVPKNFFTAPWGEHDAPEVDTDSESEGERIQLGSEGEEKVRKAAWLAGKVLHEAGKLVKPGVTTAELDRAVHQMIVEMGAYPSPLGYSSFPKSCTTSVNNILAHGIPDDRPLHPKDIINIDITLFADGYHGDTSATFLLPDVDRQGHNLVDATEEALHLGLQLCKPGERFSEIGKVIEDFSRRHGFSVNSQLAGHGIGKRFHQPPWIFHSHNTEPGKMMPGDCFTIEPCLVQGSKSRGDLWDDGWTLATETGARSAQAEHQVLITEDGADILTRYIKREG